MKDAYYFSHDSNARKDPKIMKLIMTYGMEGYGIYWSIVEMLRDSGDYMLSLCDCHAIAYDLHINTEVVKSIIKEFSLFETDEEEKFWSNSLIERMNKFEELREKRSASGKLGAMKRWKDNKAIAPPKQSMAKERKVKESKVKEKKEKYGEFALFTEEEFLKLEEALGSSRRDEYLDKLNIYIGSTGKKYRSHYHTILMWANKDGAGNDRSSLNAKLKKMGVIDGSRV